MNDGLAVLTPFVGLPSETFVERHITGLAPGRTLTVSTRMGMPATPTWSAPPPVVVLDGAGTRARVMWLAARAVGKLRGRTPSRWRWSPSARDLDALAGALEDAGVGVVMPEFLDIWLPLLPWLKRRGLRVFPHSHGNDISVRLRSPWWCERYRDYDEADALIAVSEVARARLADLGLDRSRIHVIPCGVDVDPTPPMPRSDRKTVEVVAVGRMVPKKNPLATIDAFAIAAAADARLRLTMVGDGPLFEQAKARVRSANLGDDRVRLLGAVAHEQALAVMRDSDLFAQHSVVSPVDGDEEGLPVGVLEAMATGLPVVSTRHAGIPEAVEEGVTGVLVNEGDVTGMADALIDLARDVDRRHTFGIAGHARALERFSWARERHDLRELLDLREGAEG